ncbi:MAG: protein kinase domain-containing protein, partial [Solirubrobacteraceae bacterium]
RGALGTDAYMPPEQCDPAAHPGAIGPASDVWGLGATLHHAVSGKPPFPRSRQWRESEDPTARFPQLVSGPEPLGRKVPGRLRELVSATLAQRPQDRPTAGELALGLEPLVAELPRKLVLARGGTRMR